MAFRQLIYKVAPSVTSPHEALFGGYRGEHRATQAIFELDPVFQQEGIYYRFEFVNGANEMDVTPTFPLGEKKRVDISIPNGWTGVSGVCCLTLILLRPGEGADDQPEEVLFSTPGRFYLLEPASTGAAGIEEIETGLNNLLEEVRQATEKAEEAAAFALESVTDINGQRPRETYSI